MIIAIAQIATALGHAKKSGSEYVCSCPCHDDKHASLSLTERNGKLLFHCHAGCDKADLVAEFKRRGWLNGAAKNSPKSVEKVATIVETFPYVDEAGDLLYQAVRYEPKAFKQRRPDGNGGWIWHLDDTRRVLYCLPELLEDLAAERTIFIVEGERKVDLLLSWNIPATCNSGGAEKWLPEFSGIFSEADVVLLPDNDEPGRKHVEAVAASLVAASARVRVLELPVGPKGDIVNWAAAGGTAEQLLALVESDARKWAPTRPNGPTEPFEAARDYEPSLRHQTEASFRWLPGLRARSRRVIICLAASCARLRDGSSSAKLASAKRLSRRPAPLSPRRLAFSNGQGSAKRASCILMANCRLKPSRSACS
jgi:putative DNA primase/helicase